MKVIDLIIRLQQMNPNTEVMMDVTRDGSEMFKLVECVSVNESTTATGENIVMLSNIDYGE